MSDPSCTNKRPISFQTSEQCAKQYAHVFLLLSPSKHVIVCISSKIKPKPKKVTLMYATKHQRCEGDRTDRLSYKERLFGAYRQEWKNEQVTLDLFNAPTPIY